MKLFLLALLPLVSQADYPGQFCFTGNIKLGNETWTQDHIMAALENQVTTAVLNVANGDAKLAKFLKTQGNCQADCLAVTMRPTFYALYGKLGEEFVSTDEKHKHFDLFADALCGAFRACYPHPPRKEVRKVAETIFAAMGSPHASAKSFPRGVTCPNEGYEEAFPVNEFLNGFHTTIMQVMSKKPKMQKLFDSQTKDCQKTCLQQTVPASAMTLFLTNNYDTDTGIDALTGAIHACLPGFPHDDIALLVSETSDAMAQAEAAAEARRYSEAQRSYYHQNDRLGRRWKGAFQNFGRPGIRGKDKDVPKVSQKDITQAMPDIGHEEDSKEKQQESEMFSFLSITNVIMAVSLALCVGVVLGRRFSHSGDGRIIPPHKRSYQLLPSTFGSSFGGSKDDLHHV